MKIILRGQNYQNNLRHWNLRNDLRFKLKPKYNSPDLIPSTSLFFSYFSIFVCFSWFLLFFIFWIYFWDFFFNFFWKLKLWDAKWVVYKVEKENMFFWIHFSTIKFLKLRHFVSEGIQLHKYFMGMGRHLFYINWPKGGIFILEYLLDLGMA